MADTNNTDTTNTATETSVTKDDTATTATTPEQNSTPVPRTDKSAPAADIEPPAPQPTVQKKSAMVVKPVVTAVAVNTAPENHVLVSPQAAPAPIELPVEPTVIPRDVALVNSRLNEYKTTMSGQYLSNDSLVRGAKLLHSVVLLLQTSPIKEDLYPIFATFIKDNASDLMSEAKALRGITALGMNDYTLISIVYTLFFKTVTLGAKSVTTANRDVTSRVLKGNAASLMGWLANYK